MFENALECLGRYLIPRMPGDRYEPGFARMLVLSVTPPYTRKIPAIFVQEPGDVSNLHSPQLTGERAGPSSYCRS